jgi:N-acetylated-alpha-linked acidic dipeptidase
VSAEVEDLKRLLASRREHARAVDRLLDMRAFTLAADPTAPSGLPDRESAPPEIDFSPLDLAAARLRASAQSFDAAVSKPASPEQAARANAALQGVERALTSTDGLPGRPWYRHLVYAPGMLTGYGAKTLPGVREAIEGGHWELARDYIGRTAAALDSASAKINQAAQALSS